MFEIRSHWRAHAACWSTAVLLQACSGQASRASDTMAGEGGASPSESGAGDGLSAEVGGSAANGGAGAAGGWAAPQAWPASGSSVGQGGELGAPVARGMGPNQPATELPVERRALQPTAAAVVRPAWISSGRAAVRMRGSCWCGSGSSPACSTRQQFVEDQIPRHPRHSNTQRAARGSKSLHFEHDLQDQVVGIETSVDFSGWQGLPARLHLRLLRRTAVEPAVGALDGGRRQSYRGIDPEGRDSRRWSVRRQDRTLWREAAIRR